MLLQMYITDRQARQTRQTRQQDKTDKTRQDSQTRQTRQTSKTDKTARQDKTSIWDHTVSASWFRKESLNPEPKAGTLLRTAPRMIPGMPCSSKNDGLYMVSSRLWETATGQVSLETVIT